MTQISPDHPHVHNGIYQCVKCGIVLTDVALPGSELCAWCPQPAQGYAYHNDMVHHPSCGEHGFHFTRAAS